MMDHAVDIFVFYLADLYQFDLCRFNAEPLQQEKMDFVFFNPPLFLSESMGQFALADPTKRAPLH